MLVGKVHVAVCTECGVPIEHTNVLRKTSFKIKFSSKLPVISYSLKII